VSGSLVTGHEGLFQLLKCKLRENKEGVHTNKFSQHGNVQGKKPHGTCVDVRGPQPGCARVQISQHSIRNLL
jgi:hypothetical protein